MIAGLYLCISLKIHLPSLVLYSTYLKLLNSGVQTAAGGSVHFW